MSRTLKTGLSNDRIGLTALFIAFLKVSLCGFGGGLVWARRIVVEQTHWMNEQEFTETLTLCQLMPGPNIVDWSDHGRGWLHPVALGNWVVARLAGPTACPLFLRSKIF